MDKYVEFELACDFKNLDNGYTETYYATVGIDAGRTSPSSTGAALRGKAGTCYEQLTPCTVKQIKPSTANICKPISETTSKAQTPSGCSSSSTCSITLVGSGDTSSDTSASVNLTGGSTLSTKLDYGNNFRTSWTNLKCGVAYNIKASDCKAGSNTCTVEASPSTISKLSGNQSVTVTFKHAQATDNYRDWAIIRSDLIETAEGSQAVWVEYYVSGVVVNSFKRSLIVYGTGDNGCKSQYTLNPGTVPPGTYDGSSYRFRNTAHFSCYCNSFSYELK